MNIRNKGNKENQGNITRRDFIKESSALALGGALLLNSPKSMFSQGIVNSDVVCIRNKDVFDKDQNPRQDVIQEMLDAALVQLTGKPNAPGAWKSIIKPTDIVGIKTNAWSPIGTPSQVENALKKRVMDAGVPGKSISVLDRGVRRDPVFQKATALINVRPMRTHHWAGVGSLIKNYISFVPDPFNYHDDACSPLGKIWNYPIVKDKTRLNVLVMLTPQFHGVGPHSFSPRYVWKYYGLLVGFDPVAVDTMGVQIIQAQRRDYFGEDRPLNPLAKHIKVADTTYNLGISDPKKIKLIKIGYDKEILI